MADLTSQNAKPAVSVALSGGVDSSVAAWLMKQHGYDVSAIFMKNWEEDDDATYCAAAEDLNDAQQVCDKLGIELRSVNFASEYWDNVFEDFLEKYPEKNCEFSPRGRTKVFLGITQKIHESSSGGLIQRRFIFC